jgi:predicted permease
MSGGRKNSRDEAPDAVAHPGERGFLIGVVPSATAASVLAQSYGAYVKEAAATTAASTFFSIISISLGLAIEAAL